MLGPKCWFQVNLKTECMQGSFLKRMHARIFFLSTTLRKQKGYFDGCTQQTFQWATDARKVWGKSQMHATYIPDVGCGQPL